MEKIKSGKNKLNITLIILVAVLGSATAEAAFMNLQITPYDRQMVPIQHVLQQEARKGAIVKYDEVVQWMRKIRNFRYSDTDTWHTPQQTEKRRAGDCKDKAVLLLNYFKQRGCANVKLVIGKMSPDSKRTHAWVEWRHNGKWIILDPAYDRKPVYHPRRGEYTRQYVFMRGKKYAYVSNNILTTGL